MSNEKTAGITDQSGKKAFISKREFWMFGIAAFGQAMIYGSMSNYISDYYLNVLALSPWFVLLLMLLARVWDAINDPLMGIIADRHTFKKSKYKPYIMISALPIALLTFFMFYNPGITNRAGLMAFNAVVYVLWGMIYTMSDVPFWSLPNVMTPNPDERGKVFSFARTLNGIGGALPILLYTVLTSVIPKVRADLSEVEQDRMIYLIVAITMSVMGICLYITAYFNVKERVVEMRANAKKAEPVASEQPQEKSGILSRLFHCKPLMLVVTMGVLSFGRYLMQAAAPHVARYAFVVDPIGDIKSRTIVNIVIVASAGIGMFGSMLLMPTLYKKFNYKQIVIGSCLMGFLSSIITTVLCALVVFKEIGWLFYVCIPLFIIQSIPLGVLNVTSYAMVGDCLDYMEYTTGHRDNAVGSAVQGFVNKIGNCFATCFVIIMYLIVGLNVEETVKASENITTVLTKSQQFGMGCLVSIVPGLCLLLCAIPIFFYDLVGEKKKKVTEELAVRRGYADSHDELDRETESIELINGLTQNQSAPEKEE